VGQLLKNDVCLTQCYKLVQKEDVVSMIAENMKVHHHHHKEHTAHRLQK